MNAKAKFFLLVFVGLAGLFVLFWLFNTCAYNFWLANQRIEGRELYERRLYWLLALFVSCMALEVWIIWKAAKSSKALNDEPPSNNVGDARPGPTK